MFFSLTVITVVSFVNTDNLIRKIPYLRDTEGEKTLLQELFREDTSY